MERTNKIKRFEENTVGWAGTFTLARFVTNKRFDENIVGWAGHAVNKQETATSEFSKVSTHILQEFTCDTNIIHFVQCINSDFCQN